MTDQWKRRNVLSKTKGNQIGKAGWYSRGYLPHFSRECVTQMVTYRLFDAMPQEILQAWREELKSLPPKEAELERRKRIDAYLDQGFGSCFLRDERIAAIVQESFLYGDGDRYRLHA